MTVNDTYPDNMHVRSDLEQAIQLMETRIHERLFESAVVLVAVVGGSATGKTSIAAPAIAAKFGNSSILSEDNYCIGNSGSRRLHGEPNLHVLADYDPERIRKDLTTLKQGQGVDAPLYSFETRERQLETLPVGPSNVVVMEGHYLLQPKLEGIFDESLFIATDDHSRFARRMIRPRRNPNQPDTHRVKEYFERSYPAYHKEVAPYAGRAAIVATNTYKPDEAFARLDTTRQPDAPVDILKKHEYHHPNMADTERLTVTLCANGIQRMTYMPDYQIPEKHATFSVPIDDYVVDPTKVGYTRY